MKKIYKKSLFIFRRDLRLEDNTGLINALEQSELVIPCFIFDPRQVGSTNLFRSLNAIQYMIESLKDLALQLTGCGGRLYFFSGLPHEVVERIIAAEQIDAVFVNNDYTPFSMQRDDAIRKACFAHECTFHATDDLLLNPPQAVMTGTNTPYGRFTPFYKKSLAIAVNTPTKNRHTNYYTKHIATAQDSSACESIATTHNPHLLVQGGSKPAQAILDSIADFKNYAKDKDVPCLATTHLSAPLKFGTVSARQGYHAIANALGAHHPLIRQLYWRDFYTYIAYHSPFVFGHAYHKKYDALWWKNDPQDFERWCKGQTGFPIVDAGMRQLNTTGFMHNRVRMIVASFLTKDLHIDWQWGERYFAQQLADYDPALNNGNWQWTASTGCDAQPYFRIFNPWLQQKKFDPECRYIKQWVPELAQLPVRAIHAWHNPKNPALPNYPKPMVDHAHESVIAKQAFRAL